ncbi:MAG: recombinase family protein [Sphingobacteriales bacterium]|nr:recombinase family protein [Sphingobacteriales bacterium]
MKRAILMARVSSEEQAKGYSLDIQTEKLLAHCQRENITVVNIFREDHSAKNFNRPEFKKLLLYLSKNKGKVDLLLVTSWDRFSRNLSESFAMITRLRNYKCEAQAIEQPLDLSIPENLMILSVYLAMPDIDNKRRSMKITEGVRAAKKQGRWLGKAPYGYKIDRDEKNKPLLIPGEKSKIVRKIFADLAKGYAQSEIREALRIKGVYFSRSTFSELIRNQLYIGKIFVTDGTEQGGYYVKGMHQGLISELLFNQVQEKLEENLRQKKFVKAKSFRKDFLLRGIINCDNCGKKLTGSTSRNSKGVGYNYYHCNHCHKVRIQVSDIDERIKVILEEININSPAKKLYDIMIKKIFSECNLISKRPKEKIEQEMSQLESRIQKLEDSFADGIIEADALNKGVQ